MSDDQLSWENIFAKSAPKETAGEAASSKAAPAAAPKSAGVPAQKSVHGSHQNSRTNSVPKSGRAKAQSSRVEARAEEIPLSAMDWAPLGPPPPPQSELSVAASMKALVPPTQAQVATIPLSRQILNTDPADDRGSATNLALAEADSGPDELEVREHEPQVISVHQLNKQIRSILEGKFPLVWVKGEISNFKAHTSGHFYFSLKDSKAQVSAVMFRGFNQQLKFRPEDGMEVIVRGRVTVYEPRGNYQMFCEMMEPVGAGALQKAFEQLKAKLQAEGLFDPARKRALPALPKHIAIVTSPTGAAIRDMLNVLGRRFKGLRITVVPTKVQGEQAAGEIVAAIELANRIKDVDVMIVGRGGGSIEDMWCFNDERVARAISAARVPVISAVGHEIDFTISDFVADLRAPTPSAAAELVVKNASDLQTKIDASSRTLKLTTLRKLEFAKHATEALSKRLVDPQRRIQDCMLRSDELTQRLEASLMRGFESRRMSIALMREKLGTPDARVRNERQKVNSLAQRLATGVRTFHQKKTQVIANQMALLDSLSPLRVVERGYSLVTINDKVVNSVDQIREGEVVCIQFAHGRASASVQKIENKKGVTDRE